MNSNKSMIREIFTRPVASARFAARWLKKPMVAQQNDNRID